MSLFSTVTVDWPLPDGREGGDFRTEDLPNVFARYRLGADGVLMTGIYEWVDAPPGERRPLGMTTYMKQVGEEPSDFSGYLSLETLSAECRRYVARFEKGRLLAMRAGGLDAWAEEARDARHALEMLRGMLAPGLDHDIEQLRAFVEAALAGLPAASDPPAGES